MSLGLGLSCDCCGSCCKACTEQPPSLVASIEFVDAGGTFTSTPLSEGGSNPVELPNTISAGSDINGIEISCGAVSCDHNDTTCLKLAIEDYLAGVSDSISLNTSGNSNGYLCEATSDPTISYSNGGSSLSIPLRVFTFTTDNGNRYVGAYLVKDDADSGGGGQIQQAGWNLISTSKSPCDGTEETITLAYLDNDYGGTTCNNVGGFTETVTYTQVIVRLTAVP